MRREAVPAHDSVSALSEHVSVRFFSVANIELCGPVRFYESLAPGPKLQLQASGRGQVMKKLSILVGSVLLVIIFLPACAPEPAPPTEAVTNVEADIEALKAIPSQWEAAYHANDLDAVMQDYAQDAVRMPPNEAIEEGKEAIRNSHQAFFSEYTSDGAVEVVDIQVSGDLGYFHGTYKGSSTPKAGGEPIIADQKFVVVTQRQADGSWKTICEIWNENSPPQQK